MALSHLAPAIHDHVYDDPRDMGDPAPIVPAAPGAVPLAHRDPAYANEAQDRGHDVGNGNIVRRNVTKMVGEAERPRFAVTPDDKGRAVGADGEPLSTAGAQGLLPGAAMDRKIYVVGP